MLVDGKKQVIVEEVRFQLSETCDKQTKRRKGRKGIKMTIKTCMNDTFKNFRNEVEIGDKVITREFINRK